MTRLSPLALFFVIAATLISGGAGLTYEVVWSRMLVIPIGNSGDATALVLSAFMLGIALGAWLLGSLADRLRSPLKLYAILELLLGIYAIFMPFLLSLLSASDVLSGSFESRPWAALGRLAVAGFLVIVPSLAMGATLPVLVRALSLGSKDVRFTIGLVYGANTLGAALGAALAGFFAIPALGLTLTSTAAAGASFVAGLIIIGVARLEGNQPIHKNGAVSTEPQVLRPVAIVALLAAACSGFAMLGAEVLWARILTFVFGHDTYAFAVLLAVVLGGLGIGGLIHRRLAGRNPALVTAVLLGLLAMTLLDSFWMAASVTVHLGRDPFGLVAQGNLADSLWLEFYRELLFAPILVLIPAVLAGAAFPSACVLFAGPLKQTGTRVGTATLVNGIGAAIGALLTSFVLVAWLGIQGTIIAIAFVTALVAVVTGLVGCRPLNRSGIILVIGPALLTVLVAVLMPASLPKAMLREAVGKQHQEIVFYQEGRTGTVSVTVNRTNQEKQLFMNAVNEVTTRLVHDQSFKLLGHLGPLLHPRPQKGLMICFGAGLSAGAALAHPLKTLDVVELSSTIPKAAALWKDENNNVLTDPRFTLHIGDGRHFLRGTKDRYDVVMVDSTHPKAVDSWILYTKEFYELIRSHLAEDGIAVQWVPLHGLSEREFKIIVRSFQSVFPETTLWANVGFETYGQAAYVKLVGTKAPLLIDYRELAMRLDEPRIHRDLAPFGMAEPVGLLDCFLAGPRVVAAWTDGLPVQTDNHPIVPHITTFSKGRRMEAPLLLSVRGSVQPLLRRMGKDEAAIRKKLNIAHEAQGFLLAGLLDRARETQPDSRKIGLYDNRVAKARDYYLALAEVYGGDGSKLFEIGSYLGNLGHAEDARRLYERAQKTDPSDQRIQLNLALVFMDLGKHGKAIRILDRLVKADPKNALCRYNLGIALLKSGDKGAAISHLEQAIALKPSMIGARLALAESLIGMGRVKQAEADLNAVIAENRWVAEAWDLLGLAAAAKRDWAQAKKHHIRALGLEPYRAATHYNLGIALEEEGRLKEAAAAYQASIRISPNDAEAHNNLGLVYAAAGLFEQAQLSHLKALDIDPAYPEAAYNLGLAYRAMGNTMAAAEAFGLALKLAPTLAPAQMQLKEMNIQKVQIEVNDNDAGPDSRSGSLEARND